MCYYDRLWQLLLKKKTNKSKLCKFSGVSSSTMAKMTKNEQVTMSVLIKICIALECDIGDIVSIKYDIDKEKEYE